MTEFPIHKLFDGVVQEGPNGSLIVTALSNDLTQNEVFQVSTAGAMTPYQDPCGDFQLIPDLPGFGGRIALVFGRDFRVLRDRQDHCQRRRHVL